LANLITKEEARIQLTRLGVDAEWAGEVVESWDADKIEKRKELTKDDIKNAIKAGVLKIAEGFKKLIEIGYDKEDAKILLRTWGATESQVAQLS